MAIEVDYQPGVIRQDQGSDPSQFRKQHGQFPPAADVNGNMLPLNTSCANPRPCSDARYGITGVIGNHQASLPT